MKHRIVWQAGMLLFFLLFMGLIGYSIVLQKSAREQSAELHVYSKHYAFISDTGYSGEMWQEIYSGAKEYGEENDIMVEWFGIHLVEDYSKSELMKMAIEAGVDGIIVQGDDSSIMNDLVNEADRKGIPVVTVWQDCYGSYRKSFVGMSSYNLGQEYGNYLLQIGGNAQGSLLVIINTGNEDSGEKLVYTGIRETLTGITADSSRVDTLIVDGSEHYGIEESIRTLLLEGSLPDIIVCLDEQTTNTMIRLMVDYNKVGAAKVVGFYDSQEILGAVQGEVICATLSSDCHQMGEKCVAALMDYETNGYVSEYVPVEVKIISKENVDEYLFQQEEESHE